MMDYPRDRIRFRVKPWKIPLEQVRDKEKNLIGVSNVWTGENE